MENVTLTEEQFERLLTAGRGPVGKLAEPTMPTDAHRCQSLAIELLQLVNRNCWYGSKQDQWTKYDALVDQLTEIAKGYI